MFMNKINMQEQYFKFYEITENDEKYAEYLKFRHLIFVKELQNIAPQKENNSTAVETDQFDSYSRHVIAIHNATGIVAGCARLILPNPEGLNTESRYCIEEHPYAKQQKKNTGEISRMAISPDFRRRKEDDKNLIEGDPNREIASIDIATSSDSNKRNYQPGLIMGMYREIYFIAQQENINFCIAAMDQRFSRLLIKSGYPFHPIGPVNPNLTPLRRPFIISQEEMKTKLAQLHPELMAFMQQKN